jgi:hypothetical protein
MNIGHKNIVHLILVWDFGQRTLALNVGFMLQGGKFDKKVMEKWSINLKIVTFIKIIE